RPRLSAGAPGAGRDPGPDCRDQSAPGADDGSGVDHLLDASREPDLPRGRRALGWLGGLAASADSQEQTVSARRVKKERRGGGHRDYRSTVAALSEAGRQASRLGAASVHRIVAKTIPVPEDVPGQPR